MNTAMDNRTGACGVSVSSSWAATERSLGTLEREDDISLQGPIYKMLKHSGPNAGTGRI